MSKYEAMIIIKPTLTEEERKSLFGQINDSIIKYNGKILQASVWAERKKLTFRIKKFDEGVYYLVNFDLDPKYVKEIRQAWRINENILRALITV